MIGKGDVSPSELIQFSDRSTGSKPLGIWAFGRWLPLGGLLFCPEIGGGRAAGVHTVLTMHTLLTIADGIVKRVGTIVKRVQQPPGDFMDMAICGIIQARGRSHHQ